VNVLVISTKIIGYGEEFLYSDDAFFNHLNIEASIYFTPASSLLLFWTLLFIPTPIFHLPIFR